MTMPENIKIMLSKITQTATQQLRPRRTLKIVIRENLWSIRGSFSAI